MRHMMAHKSDEVRTNTPLFHAYYLKEDIDQIWMQKSKEEGEKQLLPDFINASPKLRFAVR